LRRRLSVLAIGLAVAATAASPATASGGGPPVQTYSVTFTNVNDTQWFTPPVVATHNRRVDVFEPGHAASAGVREVAENGNVPFLVDALSGVRGVHDVQVGLFSGTVAPLEPGKSVTVDITGTSKTRLLSSVSMLICTNDGFTGLDSLKLPRRIGRTVTAYASAYDAGTEVNTENLADMVPPCQGLNGPMVDAPGSGVSDPALYEGGVITHHAGIMGVGDLRERLHGWDVEAPVLAVTITRTG